MTIKTTDSRKSSKLSTASPAPKRDPVKKIFTNKKNYEELAELKVKLGDEAEAFVIKYEKKRVGAIKEVFVKKVSSHSGYDIKSYNSESSTKIDRFIEVKSCGKDMIFYLTHNEIKALKTLGDNYFLYLVDRTKMGNQNYHPTIIKNPYAEIILKKNETWDIDKIKVTLK